MFSGAESSGTALRHPWRSPSLMPSVGSSPVYPSHPLLPPPVNPLSPTSPSSMPDPAPIDSTAVSMDPPAATLESPHLNQPSVVVQTEQAAASTCHPQAHSHHAQFDDMPPHRLESISEDPDSPATSTSPAVAESPSEEAADAQLHDLLLGFSVELLSDFDWSSEEDAAGAVVAPPAAEETGVEEKEWWQGLLDAPGIAEGQHGGGSSPLPSQLEGITPSVREENRRTLALALRDARSLLRNTGESVEEEARRCEEELYCKSRCSKEYERLLAEHVLNMLRSQLSMQRKRPRQQEELDERS